MGGRWNGRGRQLIFACALPGLARAVDMHREENSNFAQGKIVARPVFHGVIRSRPDVTSMVMRMQMAVVAARMTMLAVDASCIIAGQLHAEPSISTVDGK